MSSAERDRSVWTDTPAERERKQRGQESEDAANASSRPLPPVHSRYDEDIRRNVQQYNVCCYYDTSFFSLLTCHIEYRTSQIFDGDSPRDGRKKEKRTRRCHQPTF